MQFESNYFGLLFLEKNFENDKCKISAHFNLIYWVLDYLCFYDTFR